MTEQDIVNLVTESVTEDAKKLRGGVIFADHLPKNPQGKLLRRKLVETYENAHSDKVLWSLKKLSDKLPLYWYLKYVQIKMFIYTVLTPHIAIHWIMKPAHF